VSKRGHMIRNKTVSGRDKRVLEVLDRIDGERGKAQEYLRRAGFIGWRVVEYRTPQVGEDYLMGAQVYHCAAPYIRDSQFWVVEEGV